MHSFNIPPATPLAFELYKIGLFKFPWGCLEMDREGGVDIYERMNIKGLACILIECQ